MPRWTTVRLGDHADLISGHPFKSSQYSDNSVDIRLLRGDNVGQGYLRWNNAKRWAKEDLKNKQKFTLCKDDIILAMDRPWIEAGLKYAWVTKKDMPSLLVQRVARLRGTRDLETRFLRYIIGSPQFTGYVKTIITGVNVPHISARDIKSYEFPLPPLDTQRKIAGVLSAYDELIENNTRRIEILEEMARNLYREWFVNFRYPGHEKVPLVDSPMGQIPKGWQLTKLKEVADIQPGYAFKRSQWSDNGIPVLKIKNINSSNSVDSETGNYVPESTLVPKLNKFVIKQGDLVVAMTGATAGKSGLYYSKKLTLLNQRVARIRTKKFHQCILWAMFSDKEFQHSLFLLADGAAQPNMSGKQIENIEIIAPTLALINKFSEHADPLLSQSLVLQNKQSVLSRSRDLLLPKLISGEIDVSDLPIKVMPS